MSGTAGAASAAAAPAAAPSAPAATGVPGVASSSAQPAAASARARGTSRAARVTRVSAAGAGAAASTLATGPAATAELAADRIPAAATPSPRAQPAPPSSNPLQSLGGHIPLPIPVPDWSKPIIIALLLLAAWFGARLLRANLRARRLERQRTGLLADLGVMQTALVPEVPARLGPLAVSVAYRPAEGPAAGGDFYDVFPLAAGDVAMVLGDVAGHGHEALKQAALTHYTLRAYLQAGLEPRAALALAGRVLADRTSERHATVAVGVYRPASGTLTYALAGHPPPILLGVPAREPLTLCSSPPIGWGMQTGRRQTTVTLPAGSEACFFSDGLIEARCKDGLLGRERLGEILAGLGSRPQAADLLGEVRASADGAPDDMVACILSPQSAPTGQCRSVEELEVDTQALRGEEVRRWLSACGLLSREIGRALENARELAAVCGSALLRVEFIADSATVSVSGCERAPARPTIARHSEPAGDPALHALSAS